MRIHKRLHSSTRTAVHFSHGVVHIRKTHLYTTIRLGVNLVRSNRQVHIKPLPQQSICLAVISDGVDVAEVLFALEVFTPQIDSLLCTSLHNRCYYSASLL